MKKIIIPILVLTLFGFGALAANSEDAGGAGQATDQGQQTQTEQATQNQGEEQQLQTREETQTREGEEAGQGSAGQSFILEAPKKAQTMNEVRAMVQERQEEMQQEMQDLSGVQQKVYEKQNKVREAVHALLSIETLAVGIGPQVSEVAREFNNSILVTVVAEEKIQKRNALVRFFAGGEKDAAGEIEGEITQNQERIQELKQLREECACGEEVKTMMQEQIQTMEQEQERLQLLADRENNTKGVFGWFRNLFRFGR